MKKAGWITLFYGFIVLIGGFMGFLKAASMASLIMGGIFGVLLILSAIGMLRNKLFPAYVGLILVLLLDGFFTYRYLLTYSFFPSGFMCLLSLFVLIINVFLFKKHLGVEQKDRKNRR